MKRIKTQHLLALAAIALISFASCSTEQAVFTSTEDSIERIDMVIEGNDDESIFLQSETTNSLVDYNFYGAGANQFDIHLNIDADRTLIIKLVNETATDLWAHEVGYSMFATRDLDDKQQYVTVEMTNGSEVAAYKSNIGDVFPQGTTVNAFNIIDFNPSTGEIYARIIDMPMMSTTDQETLNINGTFRGSINFNN